MTTAYALITETNRALIYSDLPVKHSEIAANCELRRRNGAGQVLHVTRLQALGWTPTVPVTEIQPGDVMRFNYGSTATVVRVEPVGKASVRITTRSDDGREFDRTYRRTRRVPSPRDTRVWSH